MNATTYTILMIVSFALSGVFLIVAILLFFLLRIKSVMDELSGKKAREQVSEIMKENSGTKSRGYVPGIFNARSERITSSLANEGSKKLKKATSQLSEKENNKRIDELLDESGGTVVLSQDMVEPENDEGTTVLGVQTGEEGTTILVDEDEGTTLLTEENDIAEKAKKCNLLREITVFEAKEYIEVEQ